MRIGVDLMGGDYSPPEELFHAIVDAVHLLDPLHSYFIFATPEVIQKIRNVPHQVTFFPVEQEIRMDDDPLKAIRHKKDSSLVQGIRQLKRKKIDAFVSGGNTGALIACSALTLPKLPGIKRPALLATLPTANGTVAVVDVGGSVSCQAVNLIQFARLGAAYQSCYFGIHRPRVGLLNIGIESKKGTSEVRRAFAMLQETQESNLQFIGNIEGRDTFNGMVDVLVTDGFTGNVLLKTAEGVSALMLQSLSQSLKTISNKKVHDALSVVQRQFDYAEQPGAMVCGVEGVVVKCHGNTTPQILFHGILGAITLVEKRIVAKMKHILAECQKKEFYGHHHCFYE